MRKSDWMTCIAATAGNSDALRSFCLGATRIRTSTFLASINNPLPKAIATALIRFGSITRVSGTTHLTQAEDGGGLSMYHMLIFPAFPDTYSTLRRQIRGQQQHPIPIPSISIIVHRVEDKQGPWPPSLFFSFTIQLIQHT